MPKKIVAGDVIQIESSNRFREVYLNGVQFIPVKENFLIAGTGATGREYLTVHGIAKIEDSFFDIYPTVEVFRHEIKLIYKYKRRAKLRLPREVQRRISSTDDAILKAEREQMRIILANQNGQASWECWQKPLNSKVVSKFASPRTLPSGRQYFHSGLDLRAATGTPIRAPASGKIVYADHMTIPGNVVVIDHGGGLMSRYMHLDKIISKLDSEIKANEILGLAGATGRVEAPHLHWEVLLRGIPVDPLRFLRAWEQLCDRG